jgi:hypothetical protein
MCQFKKCKKIIFRCFRVNPGPAVTATSLELQSSARLKAASVVITFPVEAGRTQRIITSENIRPSVASIESTRIKVGLVVAVTIFYYSNPN